MKLKKLEVSSFAGINPESPVVIDFTNSKFVTVEGDMGVGKTSLLNALMVACGQLSKDSNDKSFVNNDTGKIDINFSFVGKDRMNYEVRCTKSSFQLTYEGTAVPEPITKMKELLGIVGVSPMEVKHKPLKEIVKWLASYSNKSPEEFEGQLLKCKNGIKLSKE
jgi:recombinational DNA repair ATPase RecF